MQDFEAMQREIPPWRSRLGEPSVSKTETRCHLIRVSWPKWSDLGAQGSNLISNCLLPFKRFWNKWLWWPQEDVWGDHLTQTGLWFDMVHLAPLLNSGFCGPRYDFKLFLVLLISLFSDEITPAQESRRLNLNRWCESSSRSLAAS